MGAEEIPEVIKRRNSKGNKKKWEDEELLRELKGGVERDVKA